MPTPAPVRALPPYRNERYCGRRRRDRHAEPHHQDLPGQRLTFPAGITRYEARATTRLYLITPPALDPDRFAKDLEAALAGGDVACLQLRLKDVGDNEIRRATRILQPIAQERGAAFIMNDRPDLAAELECDGVHVGEEDTPYAEARLLLGPDRIVGVTCGDTRGVRGHQSARSTMSSHVMAALRPEMAMATQEQPTVVVIDDDASVRKALDNLFRSVGLEVELFGSPQDFLQSERPDRPGCIVLDVRFPGRSGLDMQREISAANTPLPIIFITGYGDIPMSVRAMKAGAVEFLTKPFRDQDLLDAVGVALEKDRVRRANEVRLSELRTRFQTLTARERQVLSLVIAGRLNKQIAGELGVSEMTVKMHRRQVMRKMQATGLAQLVRLADQLGLGAPHTA